MSLYSDELDKHYILDDLGNQLKRKSSCWSIKSVGSEEDKKARREVANNNERKRMQSINTGFENLRKLLPSCAENDKISKASILQTTATYILELQQRLSSLENDILRSNPEKNMRATIVDAFEPNAPENALQYRETTSSNIPSYMSDMGSSTSSLTVDYLSSSTISLKSCDNDTSEYTLDNYQPQSSLEHLLAAVAQVERQGAPCDTDGNIGSDRSPHSSQLCVMKPTINPYAEQIIQDAVNMQRPYPMNQDLSEMDQNRLSRVMCLAHKYQHRPDVVFSRCNNC